MKTSLKRVLLSLAVLALGFSSLACRLPLQSDSGRITDCTATLAAVGELWADYPFPEHFMDENPVKQGGEFDPMTYFTAFNHLSMEAGYALDFVYTYDFMGGYPTLLARPTDEAPYRSWADVGTDTGRYLEHVVADGSPESYFQFVALGIMGEQFYLFWHAGYNDLQIVCDRQAVQAIVDQIADDDFGNPLTPPQVRQALDIPEIEPQVVINGTSVEVRVVVFTNWGGFYRLTYTLDRQFPHRIQSTDEEQLVPYDCGIMF